jgi:Zn ribbon nucleic-acid-binding protein
VDAKACSHSRTRLIAKDQDAEYVECVDCGWIFEKGELGRRAANDPAAFNETLSDA